MASHNSTFSIYIYCRLLLKRKYVWDQWMRKSKALNVNDSSGEKNMLGCDSLKEISSVSSIQGWQRGSRQMHSSAIYKGYYCIKINVKMQQNLKVVPTYHKFLLKIPFITIQQYATYFFFFIVCFFQVCLHVCTFLAPDFGLCAASVVFILCHYRSICVFPRTFSAPFSQFSCIGMKMKKQNHRW